MPQDYGGNGARFSRYGGNATCVAFWGSDFRLTRFVLLSIVVNLVCLPVMNIVKATKKYEAWLGKQTPLVARDLAQKHNEMAQSQFSFLRATFYRWIQTWPAMCPDLRRAPRVLGVGDLHVENFGTWRDAEGRLVWGINDFDEASYFPYTADLVRLAASALLAIRERRLAMRTGAAIDAILKGYREGMIKGGRPFVLSEEHSWLRQIAENELRDPMKFWRKIDSLATARAVAASARRALERSLPEPGMEYRLAHRVAGLGSLGRMRFVAIADCNGGRIAREAKPLLRSAMCWADKKHTPREIQYTAIVKGAVRCPDPFLQIRGEWMTRRLSPHCSRIELEALGKARGELRLLEAMGKETANIHLGTKGKRSAILADLRKRKPKWLERAARGMIAVVDKDWRTWKSDWRR